MFILDAYFHAHASWAVFVTTDRFATCEIDASASPRKPYVWMRDRSENWASLDVAKRVASSGRSAFCGSVSQGPRAAEREGEVRVCRSRCPGSGGASCRRP
jgi:hypothetical protein